MLSFDYLLLTRVFKKHVAETGSVIYWSNFEGNKNEGPCSILGSLPEDDQFIWLVEGYEYFFSSMTPEYL